MEIDDIPQTRYSDDAYYYECIFCNKKPQYKVKTSDYIEAFSLCKPCSRELAGVLLGKILVENGEIP